MRIDLPKLLGLAAILASLVGCGGHGGRSSVSTPTTIYADFPAGFKVQDLAFDPARGVIYAAGTAGTGSGAPASILVVSPSAKTPTNLAGAPAGTVTGLAVSGDEKYLVAIGSTAPTSPTPSSFTLYVVPLTSGGTAEAINFPPTDTVNQILALPETSEKFAVSLQTPFGGDGGTFVYDISKGQSPLESSLSLGSAIGISADGHSIFGMTTPAASGSLSDAYAATFSLASITSAGIVGPLATAPIAFPSDAPQPQIPTTQAPLPLFRIGVTEKRVVTDTGMVLDPSSGAVLGQLPFPGSPGSLPKTFAVTRPASQKVYFLTSLGLPAFTVLPFQATTQTLGHSYPMMNSGISGTIVRAVAFGADGIAFATQTGTASSSAAGGQLVFVTGLP